MFNPKTDPKNFPEDLFNQPHLKPKTQAKPNIQNPMKEYFLLQAYYQQWIYRTFIHQFNYQDLSEKYNQQINQNKALSQEKIKIEQKYLLLKKKSKEFVTDIELLQQKTLDFLIKFQVLQDQEDPEIICKNADFLEESRELKHIFFSFLQPRANKSPTNMQPTTETTQIVTNKFTENLKQAIAIPYKQEKNFEQGSGISYQDRLSTDDTHTSTSSPIITISYKSSTRTRKRRAKHKKCLFDANFNQNPETINDIYNLARIAKRWKPKNQI